MMGLLATAYAVVEEGLVDQLLWRVAAAAAGWIGGRIVESPLGVPSLPLFGAALTVAGLAVALDSLRRDRKALVDASV